ncbi:MAG: orotidine-5'-phosphate decarboxylase [Gemmatimonadaceae bacterium]|nr:orotidine-5'-phosphate decarboxylase [Gemmatimonadaceae bacterium]MDQ3518372.1 orotidine-5'-phosphate decarboxylase [Gemmatimonadota bacterium]
MISRLIVALDVNAEPKALELVTALGVDCDFYKVGSELFTAVGPSIIEKLAERGKSVFLDLKFHDIPATVRSAARSAAESGAKLITVHASGGLNMLEAAVEGAGFSCGVLGVTILTSLASEQLAETWGRPFVDVSTEAKRLASIARSAGARGVVCAGTEVSTIRNAFGDGFEILVPGLRMAGGASHDQVRIVTPREAADSGATYLVLGRIVTSRPDVTAALREVRESLHQEPLTTDR